MNELKFILKDISLFGLSFSLNPLYKTAEAKDKMEINPVFRSGKAHIDGKIAHLLLGVHIEGADLPFKIDVSYDGTFEFKQELSGLEDEKKEKFIKANCATILYPFIRETIAEITRKAGLAPLILPPIDFEDLYNETKADKSQKMPEKPTV